MSNMILKTKKAFDVIQFNEAFDSTAKIHLTPAGTYVLDQVVGLEDQYLKLDLTDVKDYVIIEGGITLEFTSAQTNEQITLSIVDGEGVSLYTTIVNLTTTGSSWMYRMAIDFKDYAKTRLPVGDSVVEYHIQLIVPDTPYVYQFCFTATEI